MKTGSGNILNISKIICFYIFKKNLFKQWTTETKHLPQTLISISLQPDGENL